MDPSGNFPKTAVSDHEQVDVTVFSGSFLRDRAEYENKICGFPIGVGYSYNSSDTTPIYEYSKESGGYRNVAD